MDGQEFSLHYRLPVRVGQDKECSVLNISRGKKFHKVNGTNTKRYLFV